MRAFVLLFVVIITACGGPRRGNIDNATILHWENDAVTTEQFVRDHNGCLGVTRPAHQPRGRMAQLVMPTPGAQMVNWEGLWVTFQSNENKDIPQRFLMSVPSGTASKSTGAYRKCMFRRGYLLRADYY